jgi:hypothetical protein
MICIVNGGAVLGSGHREAEVGDGDDAAMWIPWTAFRGIDPFRASYERRVIRPKRVPRTG